MNKCRLARANKRASKAYDAFTAFRVARKAAYDYSEAACLAEAKLYQALDAARLAVEELELGRPVLNR